MRYLLKILTEKIMKNKIKKQFNFIFIISIIVPVLLIGAFPLFYIGTVKATQKENAVGIVVIDDAGTSYNRTNAFPQDYVDFLLESIRENPDAIATEKGWNGIMKSGDEKYSVCITTLGMVSGKKQYACAISNNDSFSNIDTVVLMSVLLLVVALLISYIVMAFYANFFSIRVGDLRKAMHDVSNENYEVPEEMTGEDEISQAYDDLRSMIERIKDMDASVYEAKINTERFATEQQMMEYKMLASQINPHFLYNTLEAIRMRAVSCDDKEVADAIKLLGKSMRYVLENTGTISVPLSKEMNYIVTYIKIIKFRFAEKINYSEEVDENIDIDSISVLPLMLQPVIENAVLHGLENVVNGNIKLTVKKKDEDNIIIDITDDGCGMSPEQVEEIRKKLNKPGDNPSKSIGLYNINQRIKLFYGEKYGMTVESTEGAGTKVSLNLPIRPV